MIHVTSVRPIASGVAINIQLRNGIAYPSCWRKPIATALGGEATEVDGGTARDIRILEATAAPGTATGIHMHSGDEHHLVLEGQWRLRQGEHVVDLGPGDYLAWDPTVPHDVENVGPGPGRILMIYPRRGGRAMPDRDG